MSDAQRYVLAILVVVLDLALFVVPLTGLFLAYILIARPSWFKEWVETLYPNGTD